MQREAIGELLADLLHDAEVAPGQLTLLLPLAGGHWRVLDNYWSSIFKWIFSGDWFFYFRVPTFSECVRLALLNHIFGIYNFSKFLLIN